MKLENNLSIVNGKEVFEIFSGPTKKIFFYTLIKKEYYVEYGTNSCTNSVILTTCCPKEIKRVYEDYISKLDQDLLVLRQRDTAFADLKYKVFQYETYLSIHMDELIENIKQSQNQGE